MVRAFIAGTAFGGSVVTGLTFAWGVPPVALFGILAALSFLATLTLLTGE